MRLYDDDDDDDDVNLTSDLAAYCSYINSGWLYQRYVYALYIQMKRTVSWWSGSSLWILLISFCTEISKELSACLM